jgi:hypothetical protein
VGIEKLQQESLRLGFTKSLLTSVHRSPLNGLKTTIQNNGIEYVHERSELLKNKKTENEMPYGGDNMENRFEEFVEETNQKLKELETMIRILQSELNSAKRETVKVNITNQDIKSSLGSTIKTVGDLVRKNGFKK